MMFYSSSFIYLKVSLVLKTWCLFWGWMLTHSSLKNTIMQICLLLAKNCEGMLLSQGFSVVTTEETIQFQILLTILDPL